MAMMTSPRRGRSPAWRAVRLAEVAAQVHVDHLARPAGRWRSRMSGVPSRLPSLTRMISYGWPHVAHHPRDPPVELLGDVLLVVEGHDDAVLDAGRPIHLVPPDSHTV